MKYDCYIASGWFNEQQAKDLENIKEVLKELKLTFFSPKDECCLSPIATLEERYNTFEININSIKSCKLLISNPRDKDMGTVFETGYSFAKKIPILYYHDQKGKFNLMLAQSGIAVTTSKEDLKKILKRFFHEKKLFIKPYTGEIE